MTTAVPSWAQEQEAIYVNAVQRARDSSGDSSFGDTLEIAHLSTKAILCIGIGVGALTLAASSLVITVMPISLETTLITYAAAFALGFSAVSGGLFYRRDRARQAVLEFDGIPLWARTREVNYRNAVAVAAARSDLVLYEKIENASLSNLTSTAAAVTWGGIVGVVAWGLTAGIGHAIGMDPGNALTTSLIVGGALSIIVAFGMGWKFHSSRTKDRETLLEFGRTGEQIPHSNEQSYQDDRQGTQSPA